MGGLITLSKARWYEATEVAQLRVIRNKQIEAVKQHASVLFLAPELIGFLMDLNVPEGGFRHVSEFMTRRGAAYTAATGLPFPRPIPSRDRFMDTWKELVKPLALERPVSVADPPTSGRSWPLQSWARYIQSRPPVVGTIDWKRPLTFLLRGDAYPCAGGSWTQLSIGLLNMRFAISKPKFGLCKIECICVCTDCPLSCLLYFVCRWGMLSNCPVGWCLDRASPEEHMLGGNRPAGQRPGNRLS